MDMPAQEFQHLRLYAVDTQQLPPDMVIQTVPSVPFYSAFMEKVQRLCTLVSVVILLILIARFLLRFFYITGSLFAYWVNLASAYLIIPFTGMMEDIYYEHFLVESTTLIALIVYAIGSLLLVSFVRILR